MSLKFVVCHPGREGLRACSPNSRRLLEQDCAAESAAKLQELNQLQEHYGRTLPVK